MGFHFRKIQCSILHCTLHNLSYILWLSFEFALAIHFFLIQHSTFIYVTFKFSLSTFNFFIKQQSSLGIRSSSSVECTLIFSYPTFSICPLSFRFRHPTLDIALASFRIRHSTFRIELLPAGQRPMKIVVLIDLTHPRSNGGRESVERLPSGVDSGDLLHSRQTRRRQTCSRPCDKSRRSTRCCCTC